MATLAEIAKSVRRVRFSETGYQQDTDTKVVWHQGVDGFEMITHVDKKGHVVDHELCVNGRVAQWHREAGVKTGRLRGHSKGASGVPAAALVDLDQAPQRLVLEESAMVAELVPGHDKYLTHMATVLREAIAGGGPKAGKVTASDVKRPKQVTDAIAERKPAKGLKGLVKKLLGD